MTHRPSTLATLLLKADAAFNATAGAVQAIGILVLHTLRALIKFLIIVSFIILAALFFLLAILMLWLEDGCPLPAWLRFGPITKTPQSPYTPPAGEAGENTTPKPVAATDTRQSASKPLGLNPKES